MKIKFTASLAGYAKTFNVGETHDVPAPEAKRFIAAGFAVAANKTADSQPEPTKQAEIIETATLPDGTAEDATLKIKHLPLPEKAVAA